MSTTAPSISASELQVQPAFNSLVALNLYWLTQQPQLDPYTYGSGSGPYGSNVTDAWDWADGQGVTVSLLDDGFDLSQPGLFKNFDVALSRSFADGADGGPDTANAAAIAEDPGDFHGTTTSGDLAASDLSFGPTGIAPDATVVGVKLSFGSDADTGTLADALAYAASVSDVINNSWGFTGYGNDNYDNPALAGWFAQVQSAVQTGRSGLGCIIVFAAGNDRADANDLGLQDVSDDPRVIAVAGVEASGDVSTFSTPGAGLLVSAVATDVVTPYPGDQVVEISGTSYAAPEVSGVVALMLQVNPNLGWRDVQEILADSASVPANPSSTDGASPAADVVTNGATDWNGGGRQFSDDIGFGVVDADTAVQLARSWTEQSTSANLVIGSVSGMPDLAVSGTGVFASPLAFAGNLRIQHVQVTVNAPDLPVADLKLVLISPDGTQSVLLDNAGLVGGQDQTGGLTLADTTITSNAFWGENAQGTWTLQVQDTTGQDIGTLTDWTLQVWGDDAATSSAPLVYTPDFAALAAGDSARTVVSSDNNPYTTAIDVVGQMTGPTILNLNGGPGTIDGVPVSVQPGLLDANFDGNAANVTVVGASAGNYEITGGDAATSIVGGDGDDTIYAGLGATTVLTGAGANLVDLQAQQPGDGTALVATEGSNTVFGGASSATVFGGAGGVTWFGGSGSVLFVEGAGSSSVIGGHESDTIWAGAGGGLFLTGTGGHSVVQAGFGAATMVGGGSGDVLFAAGSADDELIGQASGESLVGGTATGTLTFFIQTGDAAFGGDDDNVFVAPSGNATLVGSGSSNTFFAGSGEDVIDGANTSNVVVAGSGNAVVQGNGGTNLYVFIDGSAGGSDTIVDFDPSLDTFSLQGYGASAAAQAVGGQVTDGAGGTIFSLPDGTTVHLLGVAHLDASAFS